MFSLYLRYFGLFIVLGLRMAGRHLPLSCCDADSIRVAETRNVFTCAYNRFARCVDRSSLDVPHGLYLATPRK